MGLSGVRVFTENLRPFGVNAKILDANTVAVDQGFLNNSLREQFRILGHEFQHIIQARTVPFFFVRFKLNAFIFGAKNPFELEAGRVGREFSDFMIPGR